MSSSAIIYLASWCPYENTSLPINNQFKFHGMSNNFPPFPVLCWGQAITTTMRQSTTQDRPAVDSSFLFFFSASAVKGFGMHWNPLLILPSLLGVLCTHWFVYVHSGCCFRSLSDSPLQHWCRAIPRCRKITSQVGFWEPLLHPPAKSSTTTTGSVLSSPPQHQ